MNSRTFDRTNVIILNVEEENLLSFLVDKDIDDNGEYKMMLNELANAIIRTIPEYVFANYEDPLIPQNNSVDMLREAARNIYKIPDYQLMRDYYIDGNASKEKDIVDFANRKGEFGELLLHLILRDFKKTIPLISKVYFKDSTGIPAHGFDSVHISPEDKILWLGESKFYTDAKSGIKELVNDINSHIKADYLNEQFIIIKKNLENNSIPQRDFWIQQLISANKLTSKVSMINIPLLCIYPHDVYKLYDEIQCEEAVKYHCKDVKELKDYFDNLNNHPLKSELNIILILFPIEDKKVLVKKLHEKLWHMQNI